MKAYVCREFGPVDSHKVEEIEDPRAEPGMVVVDVKAAGVSFPDVLICLLYTSPSPRDLYRSRMPSSA